MKILQNLEKNDVICAIEGNLVELYKLLSSNPKMELYSSEEMIWSLTDIPFPLFNMVFRSSFKTAMVEEAIEKIIIECRSRNVPLIWHVGPNVQPVDLGTILEKYGFKLSDIVPAMAIEIRRLKNRLSIPNGFQVKRVSGEIMLRKYLDVVKQVFEMPDFAIQAMHSFFSFIGYDEKLPIQHFIGILNDEPIASSMVILGAGVAGILDVATLPKDRQKGLGSFMTSFALQYAKRRGYKIGILTSSEEGFKVYKKLGFREFYKVNQYIWSP